MILKFVLISEKWIKIWASDILKLLSISFYEIPIIGL